MATLCRHSTRRCVGCLLAVGSERSRESPVRGRTLLGGERGWRAVRDGFPQLFRWTFGPRKAMKLVRGRFSTLAHPCDVKRARWRIVRVARGVKTRYLYSMSSRLVNVRLDAERLRKARTLREQGVTLSAVVREAIDERFAALRPSELPRDTKSTMRRIFEQYPDPPDLPPRDYDVRDRRAARTAILRKLRRDGA